MTKQLVFIFYDLSSSFNITCCPCLEIFFTHECLSSFGYFLNYYYFPFEESYFTLLLCRQALHLLGHSLISYLSALEHSACCLCEDDTQIFISDLHPRFAKGNLHFISCNLHVDTYQGPSSITHFLKYFF